MSDAPIRYKQTGYDRGMEPSASGDWCRASDVMAHIEQLEAALREARMQSIADLGQAQELYEAQKKAEAERDAAQRRGMEDAAKTAPPDPKTLYAMVDYQNVLRSMARYEWEEDEPNDRSHLPDKWVKYIGEMEWFCNYYTKNAREKLEKHTQPLVPDTGE